MQSKQNLVLGTSIVSLAILGNLIWLAEILYRFSWASLGWLCSQLYSPYLLVLFPATAFLLPFVFSKRISAGKFIFIAIVLSVINFLFYGWGDYLLRISFSRFGLAMFFISPIRNIVEPIIVASIPLLLFLLFGLAYFLLTKYLLAIKIKRVHILLFAIAILLVIPLSCITNRVLPFVEDSEWFFNAIKAGYPVFWITVLMGLCGWIIERNTASVPPLQN